MQVKRHVFDNGVTLVYCKNPNKMTEINIGYRGGSMIEDIEGTTHLIEHLLLRETPNFPFATVKEMAKQYGFNINGATSETSMHLSIKGLSKYADKQMELIGDMATNRVITEAKLKKEKPVIIQEIAKVGMPKDSFIKTVDRKFNMQLYLNGFIHPVLGDEQSIKEITMEDINERIVRSFNANNMIISVSSNLAIDKIIDLVEKYVNPKVATDGRAYPPLNRTKQEYNGDRMVFNESPKRTVEVTCLMPCVLSKQTNSEIDKAIAILCENYILNNYAGLLREQLRTKTGCCYAMGYKFYDYRTSSSTSYRAFTFTTTEKKYHLAMDTFASVLNMMATKGISKKDFEMIKNLEIDKIESGMCDINTVNVDTMFNDEVAGIEPFSESKFKRRLQSITVEEVNKIIKEAYTNPDLFLRVDGDLDRHTVMPYKDFMAKVNGQNPIKNDLKDRDSLESI